VRTGDTKPHCVSVDAIARRQPSIRRPSIRQPSVVARVAHAGRKLNLTCSNLARTNVAFSDVSDSAVSYSAVAHIASGIRSNRFDSDQNQTREFHGRESSHGIVKVNGGDARPEVSSARARSRVASRNDHRFAERTAPERAANEPFCHGGHRSRTSSFRVVGSKSKGSVLRIQDMIPGLDSSTWIPGHAVVRHPSLPEASSRSIGFPRNSFVTWFV
jgi:hypothetical protein